MVDTLLSKIFHFIFKNQYRDMMRRAKDVLEREGKINSLVSQRVAEIMSKMDPFEPLMREYKGVFGELFEHPEERLDARSTLSLQMLGYQLADDPSFNFLCEWIMNSQGNETLLHAAVTPERVLYGRAQISSVLSFRKEVRRLSEAYKDMLADRKEELADTGLTVEE